jgi:hypothetical protein
MQESLRFFITEVVRFSTQENRNDHRHLLSLVVHPRPLCLDLYFEGLNMETYNFKQQH